MRSYSLTLANATWESLATLMEAADTAKTPVPSYLWAVMVIKNTHATATITFAQTSGRASGDEPDSVVGQNLSAGEGLALDIGRRGEPINGENIWVYSDAAGSMDISIIPATF